MANTLQILCTKVNNGKPLAIIATHSNINKQQELELLATMATMPILWNIVAILASIATAMIAILVNTGKNAIVSMLATTLQ